MELEKAQRETRNDRLKRYLGSTLKVLVEGIASRTDNGLTGHSTCHKIVNFVGDKSLLGEIADVRITQIKSNSLFGEMI